ncbi:MAG: DNA alkylation repair protein [Verrucomicrobia bacterium]|nr:DNA alkylation repair protein [Verrucomicrobiota bacterium]|tara:strand:+ start:724 stop:1836 length:1113 start_codon:yes stop_codon:yes gene_type:complete
MADALKNVYTSSFIHDFALSWKSVYNQLDIELFERNIFDKNWKSLELKERMQKIAISMHGQLPEKFEESTMVLSRLCDGLTKDGHAINSFAYMFIPEVILMQGKNHTEHSLKCIEKVTQFTSCEFVIRPFINDSNVIIMGQMLKWSTHPHENVRRLASEGCRPKLPWAMGLKQLQKDPELILPILENLKDDPSEFVRKSVANNLNDISKDHPELVIAMAKKWKGKSARTDWIIKHACRTLLKNGNTSAIQIFDYADPSFIEESEFSLINTELNFGESIHFTFNLKNNDTKVSLVRIEYGVGFLKKNGSHSIKVFKISERNLAPNEAISIHRAHPFKPISTRKYYTGKHFIHPIINGKASTSHAFTLQNVN